MPLYWSTAKVWQPSHRSALESSFLDAEMREKNDQAMATRAKIGKASLRKKELCCDSSARVQSLMPLLQIQRRCQRAQHALGNASVTVGHGWGMSRDTLGRRRNNRDMCWVVVDITTPSSKGLPRVSSRAANGQLYNGRISCCKLHRRQKHYHV